MHFHPKIKSKCTETQVQWLPLNSVNVSFLLLVTLVLLSAPEIEYATYLKIIKGLSWFKFNSPTLSQPEPLSQESLLFQLYGEHPSGLFHQPPQKAFPFQPCVFFSVKIQYPFLINTLGSFLLYLLPLLLAPTQPSIYLSAVGEKQIV